jgi:hypothetical protein
MISGHRISARGRVAALGAAVACIAGASAPTALALNPQPLPPGAAIPSHLLPPDPCSPAVGARC